MSLARSNQVMPEGGGPGEVVRPPPTETFADGSDGFQADERENPCRRCCPLLKAAKILAFLNILQHYKVQVKNRYQVFQFLYIPYFLRFQIFVVVTMVLEFKDLDFTPAAEKGVKLKVESSGKVTVEKAPAVGIAAEFGKCALCIGGGGYAAVIQVFILIHLLAALILTGFQAWGVGTELPACYTVYDLQQVIRRVLFCKIFMWYNFLCLGFWLYLSLVAVNHQEYSGLNVPIFGQFSCFENVFVWIWLVVHFLQNVPWGIYVGLVAKACRNAVNRGTGMMMGREIVIQQPTTTPSSSTTLTKVPEQDDKKQNEEPASMPPVGGNNI